MHLRLSAYFYHDKNPLYEACLQEFPHQLMLLIFILPFGT